MHLTGLAADHILEHLLLGLCAFNVRLERRLPLRHCTLRRVAPSLVDYLRFAAVRILVDILLVFGERLLIGGGKCHSIVIGNSAFHKLGVISLVTSE